MRTDTVVYVAVDSVKYGHGYRAINTLLRYKRWYHGSTTCIVVVSWKTMLIRSCEYVTRDICNLLIQRQNFVVDTEEVSKVETLKKFTAL